MWFKTCNTAVFITSECYRAYLHNDIFLTDIIGYDRLNVVKFINYTPKKMKSWVRHCLRRICISLLHLGQRQWQRNKSRPTKYKSMFACLPTVGVWNRTSPLIDQSVVEPRQRTVDSQTFDPSFRQGFVTETCSSCK